MPIRPENRARYPADWKAISYAARQRAGFRCQSCGVRNGAWGWRDAYGEFNRVSRSVMRDLWPRDNPPKPPFYFPIGPGELVKVIEIVLTVAHLDHTPENCAPANLKAMCQRCHLLYDAKHHAQTAWRTRREGRAISDLFDGA